MRGGLGGQLIMLVHQIQCERSKDQQIKEQLGVVAERLKQALPGSVEEYLRRYHCANPGQHMRLV